MNVAALTDEQVAIRVGRVMDGYHSVVINAAMNAVYRARKNPSAAEFTNASHLWYPPARFISARGRFNEIGEAKFYACNSPNGALFEIRPNVGDVVTILIAKSKKPFVQLASAHIGLERSTAPVLDATQRSRMLHNNVPFQNMLKAKGIGRKWLAVDNYLSDMATALFDHAVEQQQYRVTNAISKCLMRIPGVQALNYPSVATQLHGLNICMTPSLVDEHFEPGHAWMVKVIAERTGLLGVRDVGRFFGVEFMKRSTSIDSDGTIHWIDIPPDPPRELVSGLYYRSPITDLAATV